MYSATNQTNSNELDWISNSLVEPTSMTFHSGSAREPTFIGAFFRALRAFGFHWALSSMSGGSIRVIFWLFGFSGYSIPNSAPCGAFRAESPWTSIYKTNDINYLFKNALQTFILPFSLFSVVLSGLGALFLLVLLLTASWPEF